MVTVKSRIVLVGEDCRTERRIQFTAWLAQLSEDIPNNTTPSNTVATISCVLPSVKLIMVIKIIPVDRTRKFRYIKLQPVYKIESVLNCT